jgi:hypothetical protein
MNPVSVCVTVTVTPGSTPPLSSRTVPSSCAVACPRATPLSTNSHDTSRKTLLRERII